MELPVKLLSSTAKLPTYAHATDAGMDLYADESSVIQPGARAIIKTGIALAIPAGYVGLVWDKSGIATTTGVTTLAGVIDAGYRGEILIALLNTADTSYAVQAGQKIAQLLIQPVQQVSIQAVEQLTAAARGDNGFGSTGL